MVKNMEETDVLMVGCENKFKLWWDCGGRMEKCFETVKY